MRYVTQGWTLGKLAILGAAATLAIAVPARAEDPGHFAGYTLKVKLIGGNQYDPLYSRIPEWEKVTGAKVEILSSKNGFDLDKELKADMAAGNINWCAGWDHTSFMAQYKDLYTNLFDLVPKATLDTFIPRTLQSAVIDGKLMLLPWHTDVSNMYYQKSLYENPDNRARYKAKYGKELTPPETIDDFRNQVEFFAHPPTMYGTVFAGKEEGLNGRFYEMLLAYGGEYFDKNYRPVFNSEAGVKALQFFKDIYQAKAVPAGTINYLWDDIGQSFASGSIALDFDWPGWAAYFNDPKNSKIAGNVAVARAPVGPSGKRLGWSGSHGFSVTKACDNKPAAVSFITWMTDYDTNMLEARRGLMPANAKAFEDIITEVKAKHDVYMTNVFEVWKQSLAEDAYPVPHIAQWIEVSNIAYPEFQAAILGQKTPKEALDAAAKKATQIMEDAGLLKD
jgi:multiple sugar transport system substrate-binding protein